jgi:hypothetical protein
VSALTDEHLLREAQYALDTAADSFDWGDLTDPEQAAGACVAASVTIVDHLIRTGLAPNAHLIELVRHGSVPDDVCQRWRAEIDQVGDDYDLEHVIVAVGDDRTLDPTARQLDRYRHRPALLLADHDTAVTGWDGWRTAGLDNYGYVTMFLPAAVC